MLAYANATVGEDISHWIRVIRPSVFVNCCYGSQAFTFLQRLGDKSPLFLADHISKG